MEQTQKPAPRNLQRQRREAIAVDKNGRAMAVYILTVYATVRYSLIFPIKAAANPYNLREREREREREGGRHGFRRERNVLRKCRNVWGLSKWTIHERIKIFVGRKYPSDFTCQTIMYGKVEMIEDVGVEEWM